MYLFFISYLGKYCKSETSLLPQRAKRFLFPGGRCEPTVRGVFLGLVLASASKSISRGRLFMGMCILAGATAVNKKAY